jgi:hypothetical protein
MQTLLQPQNHCILCLWNDHIFRGSAFELGTVVVLYCNDEEGVAAVNSSILEL